jgi:2-polyprenyl-3-methyl-5-hydroxy-6-metoxy-1,4-benzoquinol methylase
MLAPLVLPAAYADWNRTHRAPVGPRWWSRLLSSKRLGRFSYPIAPGRFAWQHRMRLPGALMRAIGPFGFQANSATRAFEYPWAVFATPLSPGMRVVEVGAGASGLQFVLASQGLQVTSVDPLINSSDTVEWTFSGADFRRLNRAFGGKVRFLQTHLENAALKPGTYDRVVSISALEHMSPDTAGALIAEARRILAPGGYFIATIDLFLDCAPFASQPANQYGSNISVRQLAEGSGFVLTTGTTSELHDYPQFDPQAILGRAKELLVVNGVMTQCLVLRKPQ